MVSPRAAFRYVAEDARTGYGDAADRLVRAVRESGVQVEYRGWSSWRHSERPFGVRPHSRDPFPEARAARDAPTVAHLVPEHLPNVREVFPRGPLLAHTVWETDRLPEHWPPLLDGADRVIVPTEWSRKVFVASGVTAPVVVVPHAACDPVPGDGGVPLDLPPELVVFYTVARWDQRKEPAAVVRAFLDAFTADDPVALVVKTTPFTQYPTEEQWGQASSLSGTTMLEIARLVREHRRPPLVRVEIDDWRPSRLAGLHTRGDCYVSLSHGEGWGVGAFDAAAYGNPVVITGWGGQLAFLDRDSAFLVDHTLEPVQHFEPRSYASEQRWAVPRIDHAVELLRAVARDLDAARRKAALLRAKVLHDYSSSRVAATLLDAVPELGAAVDTYARSVHARSQAAATVEPIPRVAHFVFGLRATPEPFHLVHFLAIASCLAVVQPHEVHVHCHHLPFGPYWDLVEPRVVLHRVEPAQAVSAHVYDDPVVAHYSYAHHADFVRLDVLAAHGGLYADLDTLFVSDVPEHLWRAPFVIGREADVDDGHGRARPALSNAVLMAKPGSAFVDAWRAEIAGALDGTWANHSCFLAYDLATRLLGEVHVESQRTFHAFEPTPAGIALLLEHPAPDLDGVVSLHLAAHLWWERHRVDFSAVHAGMIDEEWVRTSPSTYASAARRFLPEPAP
ncbi:MAG TPA: glycosyltransferase [Acidimicrobiia bacterium]